MDYRDYVQHVTMDNQLSMMVFTIAKQQRVCMEPLAHFDPHGCLLHLVAVLHSLIKLNSQLIR
jgi:hypothetical protein